MPQVWDADVIFKLFKDPVRRGLFLALARHGSLPPSKLKDIIRRDIDTTIKRLRVFRSNRLVEMTNDTVDTRRQFCSLASTVPIVKTDKGRVLNFGYLAVPLDNAGQASKWDQDTVYYILSDAGRRKLLRLLFEKPLQTGLELANGNEDKRDGVLKQIAELREAGLIIAHENETDGRRLLYSLAPGIPIETTAAGTKIDFGFCSVMI